MAQRSLDQVESEFLDLQRDAGTLATRALKVRPTWGLVLSRRREPLAELERELDTYFTRFMNLDADLIAHAIPSSRDLNSAIFHATVLHGVFGMRDSVRGLLSDTGQRLAGVRNDLAFRGSLFVSIVALVVSMVAAAPDLFAFLKNGW